MVEVNSTFYSVPDGRTVERWCASTPDEFTFDVKLHQLFSFHSTPAKLLPPDLQRIADVDPKGRVNPTPELQERLMKIFLATMSILKRDNKLGALLLQLSPAFSPRKHELHELGPVLSILRGRRVAVELRNRNWAIGEQLISTLEFFREHKIAFVNVDAPASDHFTIMPSELDEITNPDLAYLRLHGRDPKAYITGKTVAARFNYDYNDEEIDEVAARAKCLATEATDVHLVFNNNALDYAPRAASRMRKALGQIVPSVPQTLDLF
jgi:uncharacterized protein YecE (DUF72 family)